MGDKEKRAARISACIKKLKPCPFCGGEAELYAVMGKLDAGAPLKARCRNQDCDIKPDTWFYYQEPENVVTAWNKREPK